MNFQKLNAVAKPEQRDVTKIADLDPEKPYTIEKILKVTTKKYGEKVIVELEGNLVCYLPARVSKDLLADEEHGLNKFVEQLEVLVVKIKLLEVLWHPLEFIVEPPAVKE